MVANPARIELQPDDAAIGRADATRAAGCANRSVDESGSTLSA